MMGYLLLFETWFLIFVQVHNIAAFIGGVGAQEALKIILQQYVSIDNTIVYNGYHCTAKHYRF